MTPLVLVILAVMWVLVLVPPLLRSRTDGRPNHSISSFQRQLRTLQRTGRYPRRARSPTCGRSRPGSAAAPSSVGRYADDGYDDDGYSRPTTTVTGPGPAGPPAPRRLPAVRRCAARPPTPPPSARPCAGAA